MEREVEDELDAEDDFVELNNNQTELDNNHVELVAEEELVAEDILVMILWLVLESRSSAKQLEDYLTTS